MTIDICDGWQLRRTDEQNWQLYQYRETKATHSSVKRGTAGRMAWMPTGRFYQHSTFVAALHYVADYELRNGRPDESARICDYIRELDGLLRSFRIDFEQSSYAEKAR